MQDFRIHHTAFLLNHADKRADYCISQLFPFKQQLPIRSIYFIQTFQNTPQICHKSEGGLYIFLFGFHHLSPLHPNSQPAEACLRKSHKIPVLVHFNPNRNPYIPYLHIKAVSTMQIGRAHV